MIRNRICTICRRNNQKLFLKGEKCFLPKCAVIKKPYGPGMRVTKISRSASQYKKELLEKQKIREFYGISEKQFKNYVKDILKKRGKIKDTALELVKRLEKRLDNTVFRLGLASSRRQARQLVTHNFFLVNKKPVNIPSYQIKKNDVISIKKQKQSKSNLQKLSLILEKVQPPFWLNLDKTKIEGKVVAEPSLESAGIPAEISSIFEFYSR